MTLILACLFDNNSYYLFIIIYIALVSYIVAKQLHINDEVTVM